MIKNPWSRYDGFWTPERRRSVTMGFIFLVLAFLVHLSAGHYSSMKSQLAPPESDLFLDNLPIIPLGWLTVFGAIVFWIFSLALLSTRPKYLAFGLKSIALFIIVRAVFMNLTREGIYPGGFVPSSQNTWFDFYQLFTFQGNLFFSAHTGFPFLMSLIFWDEKFWRRFFIIATVVFGAAVLFAHVHYSIDVFAAPFIIYGTYVIAGKLFPGDYALSSSVHRTSIRTLP